MSAQENKAKVRAFWEGSLNDGNMATVDDLVAPNEIAHGYADEPDAGQGPEATKKGMAAIRAAWPDLHITVEQLLADGDFVTARWVVEGTYQGGDPTIPDSGIGNRARITGMSIHRFENGKSVESWTEFDRLGMLRQLGVIP
jgi:predicted ester cyclase